DDKIVVGSMNRGGLRGASFEMDDRYTGYDVASMVERGIDFAKTLVRINLADAGTSPTLEATANAVNEAAAAQLPIMLEPFMSNCVNGKVINHLSADTVIQSLRIAAALCKNTSSTYMKQPVLD